MPEWIRLQPTQVLRDPAREETLLSTFIESTPVMKWIKSEIGSWYQYQGQPRVITTYYLRVGFYPVSIREMRQTITAGGVKIRG